MSLLAERWAPGIGDPTVVGWVTVVVYAAVAFLCLSARNNVAMHEGRRVRTLWLGLGILLVILGINKQLDLQSLFTQVGLGSITTEPTRTSVSATES